MRLEYFQLIDRIIDLNLAERTIRTEAEIPSESTVFEGHFPGHPLMPGVLLTEAMAQTSGWLIIGLTRFEKMPFLASLKSVKLRSFVLPGQRLTISAHLVHDGSGFAVADAKGEIAGKVVCDANITFRVFPFPHPKLHAYMTDLAKTIKFPMGALADG